MFDIDFVSGTTRVISMKSADETFTYFTVKIDVAASTEPRITIPFLADKGFKFVSVSGDLLNIKAIVFHSESGT